MLDELFNTAARANQATSIVGTRDAISNCPETVQVRPEMSASMLWLHVSCARPPCPRAVKPMKQAPPCNFTHLDSGQLDLESNVPYHTDWFTAVLDTECCLKPCAYKQSTGDRALCSKLGRWLTEPSP